MMENTTKFSFMNKILGKVTVHLNSFRSIYVYVSWLIITILLIIEFVINITPHFPWKFELPRFIDNFTGTFLITRLIFIFLAVFFILIAALLLLRKLRGKWFIIFYFMPFGLVTFYFIYTSSFVVPSALLILAFLLSLFTAVLVLDKSASGLSPNTVFRTTAGGTLGALIAFGYLIAAVAFVGFLLYIIKLLHQVIVGV
jgi:hypothetical protein